MTKRDRWAHQRRVASLGGQARAAKLRAAKAPVPPYGESFLTFLDAVGKSGATRSAWRTFWKLADGLALDPEELPAFKLHTGRTAAPTSPAREVWCVAGRRSGKSENIITRAAWRAISHDWSAVLAAGERGIVPVIAPDRDQARHTLGFLKGLVQHDLVRPYVSRVLRDGVEFRTGATVRVATASWRSTRGFTFLDVVLEESAYYRSEESANPDVELLAAVRPALLTIPDARIYGISSPYSRSGILYDAWARGWGRDGDVLVFVADTLSLNPTVNDVEIQRAFEDDAPVAASEYGRDGLVQFRSDVEALISREAVEAVIAPGRQELPRGPGQHVAFTDPSGGSQDSMTLAVAHRDREAQTAVLDCVREVRPPFSPEAVVAELAATLRAYGLAKVTGDRFGGAWVREMFSAHGVAYEPSERTKSDLYREVLPLINARRCELLDVPRLKAQLVGLERRVARGGKDSIDHAPGGHDDLANAAAGALVLAGAGGSGRTRVVFGVGDGVIYGRGEEPGPLWGDDA